jgi:hypothetical protein
VDPSARALAAKLLGVASEGLAAEEGAQQLQALLGAFSAKRYEEAEGAVLGAGGSLFVGGAGRGVWGEGDLGTLG